MRAHPGLMIGALGNVLTRASLSAHAKFEHRKKVGVNPRCRACLLGRRARGHARAAKCASAARGWRGVHTQGGDGWVLGKPVEPRAPCEDPSCRWSCLCPALSKWVRGSSSRSGWQAQCHPGPSLP